MLIRTSFLDDVTGPLAEAVTGIDDCTSLLSGLARTNSFVTPVDAARTVFRYHPLFREMLRQLARAQGAEASRAQWARAADWYRRQGDLANALKWSIRAGDTRLGPVGALARRAGRGLRRSAEPSPRRDCSELARDPPPDGAAPAELLEFEVTRRAIRAIVTDSTAADDVPEAPAHGPSPIDGGPELRATALLADLMLAQKLGDFAAMDAAAGRLLADESPAESARRGAGSAVAHPAGPGAGAAGHRPVPRRRSAAAPGAGRPAAGRRARRADRGAVLAGPSRCPGRAAAAHRRGGRRGGGAAGPARRTRPSGAPRHRHRPARPRRGRPGRDGGGDAAGPGRRAGLPRPGPGGRGRLPAGDAAHRARRARPRPGRCSATTRR